MPPNPPRLPEVVPFRSFSTGIEEILDRRRKTIYILNAMMPSCACKVALEKKSYLMGVLAPFAVLGLGSILFVCAYPGTVSLLTLMVNFIAAGADLLIALHVFREGNCLIADHPTEAGYIAFYKSGSV